MNGLISKETSTALIAAAHMAAKEAYCPYSNYPVGAALLGLDGVIYSGCNVENASYGLSICAERAAIFNAVGAGCQQFVALALAAGQDQPGTPCGACRQVLAEFCDQEMPVYCACLQRGPVITTTVGELLPLAFGLRNGVQ
ncbi:MAG: cytidine deaminase [Kiritimatiellae bacterium]|nr:cytidine deaminase [Kiritimatiellia bacterium]